MQTVGRSRRAAATRRVWPARARSAPGTGPVVATGVRPTGASHVGRTQRAHQEATMQLDPRNPHPPTTQASARPSSLDEPTPPQSEPDLRERLDSLAAHVSAVATLMTPEAAVALAYGVPSME